MIKQLKNTGLHLLYIIITKNNLKVSILKSGKLIFKKSEGSLKGIRPGSINSPDTSLIMMGRIAKILRGLGICELGIYLRGATRWKKFSLRRLLLRLGKKTNVIFIRDITGTPHNGCILEKKRRKRKRRYLRVRKFKRYKIIKAKKWILKKGKKVGDFLRDRFKIVRYNLIKEIGNNDNIQDLTFRDDILQGKFDQTNLKKNIKHLSIKHNVKRFIKKNNKMLDKKLTKKSISVRKNNG